MFKEDEILPNTLKSLTNQTVFPECEIVLAHYQSSDLLDMLFADVPIGIARRCRVINVRKKGIGYARDKGIRMSKGKYLVNFDADSFFTDENAIQRLLAPIQSGQAKMTQPNVIFNESRITFDVLLRDLENIIKRYLPYYVAEQGMCFSRSDYLVSEGFQNVWNYEGLRLALDFVKRFGWNSIRMMDDVTLVTERRRGITDNDHEKAYRQGKVINII